MNLTDGRWMNAPDHYELQADCLKMTTGGGTDLWQRSYYGFRNDNAPALLFESDENFSFSSRLLFDYQNRFDQCGLLIYLDSENWFKASVEYENPEFSRLGSVVTNRGYSDWATSDIPTPTEISYRLSRRGPDFLIEAALPGEGFRQMRIFHLNVLGETTAAMGSAQPPLPAEGKVSFGLYACSPLDSSFTVRFMDTKMEPCLWQAHGSGE
jgi:regulation of enolase protein 1 (concanavalin A-like superfamily)